MLIEVSALFLNKEGQQADKQGIETNGKDEYFQVKPTIIELNQIESFFETDNKHLGDTCCNVYMKSGELWTLVINMSELLEKTKFNPFVLN